jgi:hypothetical protein
MDLSISEKAKRQIYRYLTTKKNALKSINKFMSKNITKRINRRLKNMKQKIEKFIVKNNNKQISLYLKKYCSDTGFCLAFGRETEKINNFFQFFNNFHYVKNIKNLTHGENGKVFILEYEREKYKSHGIMKRTIKARSNNLMYEYIVGRYFINNVYKKYPCFIQTYNFAILENAIINKAIVNSLSIKDIDTINLKLFHSKKDILNEIKKGIIIGCNNPTKISLILENISNPISFHEIYTDYYFLENELIYVLFQIYYVLDNLKRQFTHYDLHGSNVLIYEPVPGSYIDYHYSYKGDIINFQSRYIVKIIDYGRSYFNNGTISSSDIYKLVCSIPECNPDCGSNVGFDYLSEPFDDNPDNYYINSSKLNNSHDLMLLKHISLFFNLNPHYKELLSERLKYVLLTLIDNIVYQNDGGTPNQSSGFRQKKVKNVSDVVKFLSLLIKNEKYNNYSMLKKIGDLEIFGSGRDMVFTESG